MGAFLVARYLWAFSTIWLYRISRLNSLKCDFGYPYELLTNNALATCHMDIDNLSSATVICPRQVYGIDYVWHPQPTADDNNRLNTYVNERGIFRSVALSNVVRSASEYTLFWIESNQSQTVLHLDLSIHEVFAINERRLIFICGPRDLILSYTVRRHLNSFSATQPGTLPWTAETPLTEEISQIRTGLGVFFNRGTVHLPLQGCGSRPSPLFDVENEVSIDLDTGTVSCVADPMSLSPIGFVCEGLIELADCISLINKSDEVATVTTPHLYNDFEKSGKWVVARYFNGLELSPINGECRCVDPEIGQVKARIEIRQKTEYTCDITGKIFRNRVRPIRVHWCSVVLHPGSTFTIKVPIQKVYRQS